MVLAQGVSLDCGQGVNWDYCHCQTYRKLKVHSQAHSYGCCQALVSWRLLDRGPWFSTITVNLSTGLLTAGNLISSEQVVGEKERNTKAVATVFLNNPISEVALIIFVKCYLFEASPVSSTHTDGEESPQRHENCVRNHCKSSQSPSITSVFSPTGLKPQLIALCFPSICLVFGTVNNEERKKGRRRMRR